MAQIEQPTVKVNVDADTTAFEAKLAQLEQRAARLGIDPLRMEAMHHAVHIECRGDSASGVDEVIATAEKLHAFLIGTPKAVNTPVKEGGFAPGGLVGVGGTTLSAEAQAQLAKLNHL